VVLYTANTVAMIVILCMLLALFIGFVVGLTLGARRKLRCFYARVDRFWTSGVATLSSSKRPLTTHAPSKPVVRHNTYVGAPGRGSQRRRTSYVIGLYDSVPTTAPPPPQPPARPPKDCNLQKCAAAIVLEPKLNNLQPYSISRGQAGVNLVDVAPPQPPPRRHRPSTKR